MTKLSYKRFVLVKDNFYEDVDKVYRHALEAEYYHREDITGLRSTEVYHEPGVKKKLERILGIKITRWDLDPREENGIFYQGLSAGKYKEVPGVHSDEPYDDITILIYLTPGLPFHCGTSLWMHKQTRMCDPAMPADARRMNMKLTELRNIFERDSKKREKWIEIDRIGYQYNRMVAYPSGIFHSATNHYGSSGQNGRLYQTFRVGVDWSSFRMLSD